MSMDELNKDTLNAEAECESGEACECECCDCVEDSFAEAAEEAICECKGSLKEKISQKYQDTKDFCCRTASRIANDWNETDGNPYIRHTCTTKIEVFRNAEDETPVDSIQTTEVKSFSLRALAIAGTVAAITLCVSGCLFQKWFSNKD